MSILCKLLRYKCHLKLKNTCSRTSMTAKIFFHKNVKKAPFCKSCHICVSLCVCVCVCVCVILCTLSFVLLEIKKIQLSAKQSGGAAANISQGPLSLGASAGGFQKSLVPLSKPGSLKRGSNYS